MFWPEVLTQNTVWFHSNLELITVRAVLPSLAGAYPSLAVPAVALPLPADPDNQNFIPFKMFGALQSECTEKFRSERRMHSIIHHLLA